MLTRLWEVETVLVSGFPAFLGGAERFVVVCVVELHYLVVVSDGDSEALVERLAAAPAGAAAATGVVPHVAVLVHHQHAAAISLDQAGFQSYGRELVSNKVVSHFISC